MGKQSKNDPKRPVSKARRIYNIVSTVVVLAVFVFLAVMIGTVLYQRKHGGDAKIFGYYMFNVVTDSMQPTINVGDVILAKQVDDVNALEVGDVITFVAPSEAGTGLAGKNETHRIVEVVRAADGSVSYFKTKGDNPNVGVDPWNLSPSAVKAKFVRVSSFITGFRDFISHWYGYVVVIVIPILLVGGLLIAGYVRDRVAEIKAEETAEKTTVDDLTDEQKRKLLEEYLASEPSDDDAQSDVQDESACAQKQVDEHIGDSTPLCDDDAQPDVQDESACAQKQSDEHIGEESPPCDEAEKQSSDEDGK